MKSRAQYRIVVAAQSGGPKAHQWCGRVAFTGMDRGSDKSQVWEQVLGLLTQHGYREGRLDEGTQDKRMMCVSDQWYVDVLELAWPLRTQIIRCTSGTVRVAVHDLEE